MFYAPKHQDLAIKEILRILKPEGKAYLKAGRGPWSYVDKAKWEKILEAFMVEKRNNGYPGGDRWTIVSKK